MAGPLDLEERSSSPSPSTATSTTTDEEVPDWLFQSDGGYFMPVNTLTYTDKTTVRRVYSLAREIARLFGREDIRYWCTGGTLLGIVRHRGLIPWDDDLDICIRKETECDLIKIKDLLLTEGLTLQKSQPYAWKIFSTENSEPIKNPNYNHRYPFCDIFVMSEAKKCTYYLSDKTGRNAWPNEFYTESQIAAVHPRLFGNIELSCPGDPEVYLDRTYGTSWRSKGSTHFFDHLSAGCMQSVPFEITQEMLEPAQPFQ